MNRETVGPFAIVAIVLGALMIAALSGGCQNMSDMQKLAAAKIIARNAGRVAVAQNPVAVQSAAVAYDKLKAFDEDAFRESYLGALKAFLDKEGIKGSEALAGDAEDLCALFGFKRPEIPEIDLDFLKGVSPDVMMEITDAFFQGAASPII